MNPARTLLSLGAAAAIALLLACGGGGGGTSSSAPARAPISLSYSDPATGAWQLKKNPNSTPDHLILDLVASGAGPGVGVAVVLNLDTSKAAWAKVQSGDAEYVRNGAVLNPLNVGTVTALKGKVSGSTLQFAVSQKGLASPATLNGTVAQIALNPVSGAAPGTVALTAVAGKTVYLKGDGTIVPMAVSIGTLSTN